MIAPVPVHCFSITFVRVKGANRYDLNDGVVCEDDPNCREFTIFIPEVNYSTPKHLIDEIQYSLDLVRTGQRCD